MKLRSPLFAILFALLLSLCPSIALADGGYQSSGGCDGTGLFIILIGALVLFGGWVAFDAFKMKTDPEYRARAEQLRREAEERRRTY